MSQKVKVGIVQASPVFMNLEASLIKAVSYIEEASRMGVQLVTFGETWLPGYPAWLDYCPDAALWNHQPTKEVFARLRQNSIVVSGKETEILSQAARDNNIILIIGINERVTQGAGNGTLYNSLLTFNSDGDLLNHHRKLIPTFTERLVWGQGDGDGLKAVDTRLGRVGSLVCWEHWMPLTRQALHVSGEQIHISVYPTVHEMHQIASRHYAFEGRCFVLAAGLIMSAKDLPAELERCAEANDSDSLVLHGGSCIIAPDGKFLIEPVFDEETIIVAELDLSLIDRELMTLDVSGHYYRPDVFEFKLRNEPRESLKK